ncbi:FMN-dependent NADH-azoreductase [Phytoactinopolyspora endophytica]|uniref:FMN-dependent NADH-azoreductase n=1 Tax=Phytoactinopolyspora endophytica TaxID=1642495 RepID=UPI00101D4AE4|nr:NAD(P)H-dependent oxidoreductase [Phytoactinopolyspora endophytica]
MTALLHISASPRGKSSESLALADVFLDAYRDAHPNNRIAHWDLWDGTLPAFGPTEAGAKMAVFGGQEFDDAQAGAWKTVEAAFQRFDSAETYLFSVPMWNHGVPYILKQFIDVVSQPGMAFSFDPEQGYSGLLQGKKAAVIYTSGVYGEGRGPSFGNDFQAPYLEDWLRWAGVADITTIELRPDLVTADVDADRRTAQAHAREVAKAF